MRKMLLHSVSIILCVCLLNACKKGFNDQTAVPIVEHPDLVSTIRMSVSGFVTDENGDAVFNVAVTAGSKSTRTDVYGYFKITDVSLSKTAAFISVNKTGYFDSYRTFVGKENQEIFTRIKLVPKTGAGNINATTGGTVTMADGSVTLPAGAVVNAASNAAYTGTVHVAAHVFKQTDVNEFSATVPGDNRGINSDGYLQLLQSYGVMAVELTGDAGELLQIAAGKEATITTPIPTTLVAAAPASIHLWSFDITKGLWKQEGTATKNGNTYSGNVSHFSFWDGALGVPLVNLTVQIVNSSLQPIANALVAIRTPGQAYTNYGAYGYTNAQGIVTGAVFANANLTLDVLTPCSLAAYAHPFTTANSDVDLGTITGDFGQSMITLTGTAINCMVQPVADGTLQVYSGSNRFSIPIVNGNFSCTYLGCTNLPTYYLAIDNVTYQQGPVASASILVPGINNVGQLQTCGTSTIGTFSITIDGVVRNYTEPTDTIGCIAPLDTDPPPYNTWTSIGMRNPGLTEYFNFAWDGGRVTGNNHLLISGIASNLFPDGNSVTFVTPVQVNVTEYSGIGGFIEGSFSGTFKENTNTTIHHIISCSFRTRRLQ